MPEKNLKEPFEIFLLGDTGDISRTHPDAVMDMLSNHVQSDQKSMVIFLGDNIYPRGLPPKGNILRNDAETVLKRHHSALKNYKGRVIFTSGNHDWNKGRKDGYQYVLRQENYIERLFHEDNNFLPSRGCPGPTEVNITDQITIVFINTQWWLQRGFRPVGKECGCRVSSEDEFFEQLTAVLDKNKDKHIIVAGHHPVYSYSVHGGRFKLKHHLFPLTLYDKDAYVPLPGLGSMMIFYRKWLGIRVDMGHPRYRKLRNRLKEIFCQYPNLIYASGHEHNLQYICKSNNHFIVSGAGSKTKFVIQNGKHLEFGVKSRGFFKMKFETDGSVFVSAWVIDTENKLKEGKVVYEKQII
jgi:hypothetical protein